MRRFSQQHLSSYPIMAIIVTAICCLTLLVIAAQASTPGRHGKHGKYRQTKPSPHVASHKPATLAGQMILTYPSKDPRKYSYGILKVDGNGCSVSSTSPLRFDLDTRTIPNGKHTLMVSIYDDAGLLKEYDPFTVLIANGVSDNTAAGHLKFTDYPAVSTGAVAGPPTIRYNSTKVSFDIPPYFDNDRIMVPLRPLIDLSDNYLDWIDRVGSTRINKQYYKFTLKKDIVHVDNKSVKMVRQLVLRKDRVFAPVAIWHDLFGGVVDYDEKTHAVTLYPLPDAPVPPKK